MKSPIWHILFCILLFLCCYLPAQAQYPYVYYFKSENTNEKIGNATLYSLSFDADSCLLIGSENGAIRYNGFEFINYSPTTSEKANYIPFSDVFAMPQLDGLNFFIGFFNNNSLYYIDSNHTIHHITINRNLFSSSEIVEVTKLDANHICLFDRGGIKRSSVLKKQADGTFKPTRGEEINFHKISAVAFDFGNFVIDASNTIWVYRNKQWRQFAKLDKQERWVGNSSDFAIIDSVYLKITTILGTAQNESYKQYLFDLKSGKKIAEYSTKQPMMIHAKLLEEKLRVKVLGQASFIWDSQFKNSPITYMSESLTHNLKDWTYDNKQNLWFTTEQRQIGFISRNAINAQQKYWLSQGIRRMASDKFGNIWLGDEAGNLLCYHKEKIDTVRLSIPFTRFIRAILVKNDELWVGNDEHLIKLSIPNIRFHGMNKISKTIRINHKTLPKNYFNIPPDSSPHLFFHATPKNLLQYPQDGIINCSSDSPTLLFKTPKHYETILLLKEKKQRSYSAIFDTEGNLWVGRQFGLFKNNDLITTIPNVQINDLKIDASGLLWVATEDEGLWTYEPKSKSAKRIEHTKKMKIYTLQLDSDGVWIGGNSGLYFLRKSPTQQLLFYGMEAGMPSNTIFSLLIHQNKLLIGTSNSFLEIDKEQFKKGFYRPSKLFFEKATVAQKEIKVSDKNSFSYNKNYLLIQLNGLSYDLLSKEFLYHYHLIRNGEELLSEEEKVSKSNRQLFPALTDGDYEIFVQRIGLDGQLYGQTPTLKFTIRPPFWKSWWFIFTTILFSIGGVLLYLRRKRVIQDKLSFYELEALSAQINPHFIGNGLNVVAAIVLTENDGIKAYNYIAKFSSMVRQFMHSTQHRYITLETEKEFLENYFYIEKLRFAGEIEFEWDIEIKANPQLLFPAGVIQPIAENAIKHGVAANKPNVGFIKISFIEENATTLICLIEDNGKGGAMATRQSKLNNKTHRSVSLGNIEKRLELLKILGKYKDATIEYIDKGPIITGTIVKITLKTANELW